MMRVFRVMWNDSNKFNDIIKPYSGAMDELQETYPNGEVVQIYHISKTEGYIYFRIKKLI